MWLAAGARGHRDAARGRSPAHSVVGEETAEYQLGTLACVRAGFRADAAVVTADEPAAAADGHGLGRLLLAEGSRRGEAHALRQPSVSRPARRPGNAIVVNALEKAIKIVQRCRSSSSNGRVEGAPVLPARLVQHHAGHLPLGRRRTVSGVLPDTAELHWMLWYLPQEDDEDVMREIEEYVLAACALDTWLVEHPPQFEWLMRHRACSPRGA